MKNLYILTLIMLMASYAHAQFVYNDFDENQNVDFSGWPNAPAVIENPDQSGINTSAMVAEWERSGEQWAHVYAELEGKIDFSTGHIFELKVWSPIACEVLFKLEDKTDGSVFTEVMQNVADTEEWVQLSFDFSGAQSDLYDKIVIFFDFATTTNNTFYFDDVMGPEYGEGEDPGPPVTLPVTFDDPDVNYNLIDFGGNISEIIVDPTDESNMVAKTIKTDAAETWAGTTVGGNQGFPEPIPFTPNATTMTVAVWSPMEGSPIRLKVEDSGDPTISVETEVLTTVANDWETLVFDFAHEAEGTAEINFDYNYNKASIFFNFGTTGADAGELTYYWDDMAFGEEDDDNGDDEKPYEARDVQENFENDGYSTIPHWYFQDPDMLDLQITVDPQDENNHVADYLRSGDFEWTNAQFVLEHRMDLTEKNVFEMRVFFPSSNDYDGDLASTAAIKLQNSLLGGDAWTTQTEILHTVEEYDTWVTLEFDFSVAADRTDYDQVVIQLGGEGHFAPAQFYFDDLLLKEDITIDIHTIEAKKVLLYPNPVVDQLFVDNIRDIVGIRIYNMMGQMVMLESGNVSSVNVAELVSGLYQVVIETRSGDIYTSKMIKQ